jgi:hypothetical protein
MSHLELVVALGIGFVYIIGGVILDHFGVIDLSKAANGGVKQQLLVSSPRSIMYGLGCYETLHYSNY